MPSRTFWPGLNSMICFTMTSLIWSDGVVTVQGVVLGEPTLLCRAIYDFVAEGPEELSLRAGDEVQCHQKQDDGWWFGVVVDGERPRGGLFPGAYVEELPEDAPRPVVQRATQPVAQPERRVQNGVRPQDVAAVRHRVGALREALVPSLAQPALD